MSAKDDYLAWRRQPFIGCMFARMMSVNPGDYGQIVTEIPADDSPAAVAAAVAQHIDACVVDAQITAAAIVLPGITTLRDLARMALALGDLPNWGMSTYLMDPPPALPLVVMSLVRQLPFTNNETRPSEVLILGPFPEFPATRRAPMTALEVFVGVPLPQDPKTHDPTTRAQLAHMDLMDRAIVKRDFTQEQVDILWSRSEKGRRESIGGDGGDNRARARVSFVIPVALATELGCAP